MFRTPRISLTMEMMVLAVGVLSCIASATVPNVQVPAPRNLRVSSYNLEHVLQWDSPNTSTSWDGANIMTYSVKQLVFNEDALEDRWEELPHCAHVRVNQCQVTNTTYAVYDTHHFKVFAEIGNRTSFFVESFKFVPYVDGMLYAPKFKVGMQENTAILTIPVAPHIQSTGELLTDFLYDDVLTYVVQYWTTLTKSPNASDIIEIRRPATVRHIPVPIAGHHSVCFRLKLTALLFTSAGWSDVVCYSESPRILPISNRKNGQTDSHLAKSIGGTVGAVGFIVLVVIGVKMSNRFLNYITARKHRVVPPSLMIVMKQSLPETDTTSYLETEIVTSVAAELPSTRISHVSLENVAPTYLSQELDFSPFIPQSSNNNDYILYVEEAGLTSAKCGDFCGDFQRPTAVIFPDDPILTAGNRGLV